MQSSSQDPWAMGCVDLTDGDALDEGTLQAELDDINDELQEVLMFAKCNAVQALVISLPCPTCYDLQVEGQIEELLARQRCLQEARERLQDRIAVDQRAPRADWHSEFPWDADCRRALEDTFGLSAYRPLQQQIINATLQGRDVLCLLPTGAALAHHGSRAGSMPTAPKHIQYATCRAVLTYPSHGSAGLQSHGMQWQHEGSVPQYASA